MLVGIVVRYTRLYIIGGIMGVLSLNYCLMGPRPQCSGLYLVIGVHCNIFSFGVDMLSLCPNLGVQHRMVGAQHLMLQPPVGSQGTTTDFDPMSCHSEVLLHALEMPNIVGEGGWASF